MKFPFPCEEKEEGLVFWAPLRPNRAVVAIDARRGIFISPLSFEKRRAQYLLRERVIYIDVARRKGKVRVSLFSVTACCGTAQIYKRLVFEADQKHTPWAIVFAFGDDFRFAVRDLAGRDVSDLPKKWRFDELLRIFYENLVAPRLDLLICGGEK